MQSTAPVTVVIPCFNSEHSITRAIDSVINQTLRPAQLILVNDASTDDTLSLLNKFAFMHPDWIKVVDLVTNGGASNARNTGWNLSNQTYIAFLDADDVWHKGKIEIQYQFMKENCDIALCGHDALINHKSTSYDWELTELEAIHISNSSLLLSNAFVTPSVMLKRNLELRFEHGKRYMEDHALWLNIAFSGNKVVKLSQKLAAISKPMFGASGLSSHMWAMEKSELENYCNLYQSQKFSILTLIFLVLFSLTKYIRRLAIVLLRKANKKTKIKI